MPPPFIPYAPRIWLNNNKRVFFGEILAHDAFLRLIYALIAKKEEQS